MTAPTVEELSRGGGVEELARLRERVERAAGFSARVAGEQIELSPTSLFEVARAQAVRAQLGPRALRVRVDLSAFDRIEAPDPQSCALRVGASARVADVESFLRGLSLTLGGLTPRARDLTVREWLMGPHAGLRPVPGNRLETAALSLCLALEGGGIYHSHPCPRSAVGPVLDALFLGAGEQAGILVEATLRALPRPPGGQESVHALVSRSEGAVDFLRSALQADVPLAEVHIGRKAHGYAIELSIASPTFRARRDRAALESLAAGAKVELKSMGGVHGRGLSFEGELAWEELARAIEECGTLGLYRLARESVVVTAMRAVPGALPLDLAPPPLPEALVSALRARALASAPAGEEPA